MKGKSGRKLIVAAAVCASLGIFASCGKEEKEIKLIDFSSSTITAEVGSAYALQNPVVKDEEGNEYTPEYVVKDAAGNTVPTIGGKLEIRNVNGYTVVYTVEAGGKTYTRTVTVSVTDNEKPVINIGETKPGYVNEEYVLPKIAATDNAENDVTTAVKLYLVKAEGNEEISLNGTGKFTPTEKGTYLIHITATDAAGNVAEKEAEFSVATKMKDFVLADFADNADFATSDVVYSAAGAQKGWLETFEGAYGVSWTTAGAQEYKNYAYRFGRTAAEMETYAQAGWDYIAVKLYIDQEGLFRVLNWNVDYTDDMGVSTNVQGAAGKQWITLYMSKDVICDASLLTYWQNTDYTGGETGLAAFNSAPLREKGITLFWISGVAADTRIYVDEISLVKSSQLSVEEITATVVEGDTVSFNVNNPLGVDYDTEVTFNSGKIATNGNSFVAESAGEYTITLISKTEGMIGGAAYRLNVSPAYEITVGQIADCAKSNEITLPVPTVKNVKTGASEDASEVTCVVGFGDETPIAVSDGKFTPSQSGNYKVIYTYRDKYTVQISFRVFADYFYTTFENEAEFAASGTTATRSGERSASYGYSAKFAVEAGNGAEFVFVSPVKAQMKTIGITLYSEKAADVTFFYKTGVDSSAGVVEKKNAFSVALIEGWNAYEFDVASAREIVFGGLVSFGFESLENITVYADDLTFYTADITFENDTDQGTSWNDAHPSAIKTNEQSHSGQYAAKLSFAGQETVCIYRHASPITVPAGTGKIGFWLYYMGDSAFVTYFSVSTKDAGTYAVNAECIIQNTGWNYYEFTITDPAELQQSGVCQMMFWSNDSRRGTMYLDDVSFIGESITFESDSDHSSTWDDANPWATKSDEQAHSGSYSAKFAFAGQDKTISIFHAATPYTVPSGVTKIGIWLYNGGESAFTASFSVSSGSFYSMTVNQAFIVENGGWHYYEFDVSAVAQTLVTNGVCQISFWSNDSRSVPVYLDDFSFIVS